MTIFKRYLTTDTVTFHKNFLVLIAYTLLLGFGMLIPFTLASAVGINADFPEQAFWLVLKVFSLLWIGSFATGFYLDTFSERFHLNSLEYRNTQKWQAILANPNLSKQDLFLITKKMGSDLQKRGWDTNTLREQYKRLSRNMKKRKRQRHSSNATPDKKTTPTKFWRGFFLHYAAVS